MRLMIRWKPYRAVLWLLAGVLWDLRLMLPLFAVLVALMWTEFMLECPKVWMEVRDEGR